MLSGQNNSPFLHILISWLFLSSEMLHLHWKYFSENSSDIYADLFLDLLHFCLEEKGRLSKQCVILCCPNTVIFVVGDCTNG